MLNTYASYQLIARDVGRAIDRVEAEPIVERETAYYLETITKVKSIDDFLGDDRLYRYAMKAYGLEDMSYAKAFVRKALTEGIDDSESFANSLADTRYRDFVEAFNFARYGDAATAFTRTQQGTVDKYMRQTLEENAGTQNEGVRLALYFDRKAATIDSWYDVLADKALSQVVRSAFGLPDSFATADIDRQVAFFETKMDVADFKDAAKTGDFIKRFSAMWELSNPTATAATAATILFSQPTELGVSTDLLMAMQSLKF